MSKETQKEFLKRIQEENKRLEEENIRLREEIENVYKKLNAILEEEDDNFLSSPAYKQYKQENEMLKNHIQILENRLKQANNKIDLQIEMLTNGNCGHNIRGAGRKKADEKWKIGYMRFVELYQAHKTTKDIINELNISRSTYFRYKKFYDENPDMR